MKKYGLLFMLISAILCSCVTDGSTSGNQVEGYVWSLDIGDVYGSYFPVGAAVSAGEYGYSSFDSYSDEVIGVFSSLVAENAMKPAVIHPKNNGNASDYNWVPADRIVQYARDNGMSVRGHVLVWHNQSPQWMTAGNRSQGRAMMEEHITTVMTRYAGDIYCWDVVNEAISDNGGMRTDSPWYRLYGDDSYIVDAFAFARAADPGCKLYYNDYNLVIPGKRDDAVEMIRRLGLAGDGVREPLLDGVGIQAHWDLNWPSVQDIQRTIDVFHDMGLEVQITELDISCYPYNYEGKDLAYDGMLEKRLADRYRELFELFRKNAEDGKLQGVTLWGIADDHTWLHTFYNGAGNRPYRANYPLLFDSEHRAKKAYLEVTEF